VCGGKAYRSDGFVELDDVHRRFIQLSKSVWSAQQECLTPDVEGLVHKWIKEKHRLPMWTPYPQFGPIYRGWDWGGQNPHAIVWVQKLQVPIGMAWYEMPPQYEGGPPRYTLTPILSDGDKREAAYILPEGALIQFDEHYGNAGILGEFSDLGIRAVLREVQWRQYGVTMKIEQDFCDPAGYIAKREVKKAIRRLIDQIGSEQPDSKLEDLRYVDRDIVGLLYEMGISFQELSADEIDIPEFKSIPAPRVESIRKHIELGEDDMIYIVPSMCPGTDDEYDVYHWIEPKPGQNMPEDAAKEDDHAMDAKRYLIWNLERSAERGVDSAPSAQKKERAKPDPGESPYKPPQTVTRDGSVPSEKDRLDYGGPGVTVEAAETEFRRARTLPMRARGR
jgi:hypothetical protein